MITCGIDWAEDHHDVALVDESGKLLAKRRIGDDVNGYRQLAELRVLLIYEPFVTARDDGQLLQRAEPSPDAGRGDLGDVGRSDDGGDAHPEATDETKDDEDPEGRGEAGPRALTRNSTAASRIPMRRPKRSANLPAPMAPAAAPSRAEATAKTKLADSTLKTFSMALTAPLITALS